MCKVTFKKSQQCIDVIAGKDFLEIFKIYRGALPLRFGCCKGECGTCVIRVVEGEDNLSKLTKQEIVTLKRLKIEGGRLACQCALIRGEVVLDS